MGDQDDARTMKTMKIPSYTGYSHQQGFQEKNQQGFKKSSRPRTLKGSEESSGAPVALQGR